MRWRRSGRHGSLADRWTDQVALLAGLLLIGWILGQIAVIRAFSFFQPIYLLIGLALVVVGRRTGPCDTRCG